MAAEMPSSFIARLNGRLQRWYQMLIETFLRWMDEGRG
jgi:hypothetical protein